MSAILIILNAHNFPIFQPILMTLVSKSMVYKALSNETYLLLELRSPLNKNVYDYVLNTNISFSISSQYHWFYLCCLPSCSYTSLVVRKPVFGVSDQVRHKPGCTTTQDG